LTAKAIHGSRDGLVGRERRGWIRTHPVQLRFAGVRSISFAVRSSPSPVKLGSRGCNARESSGDGVSNAYKAVFTGSERLYTSASPPPGAFETRGTYDDYERRPATREDHSRPPRRRGGRSAELREGGNGSPFVRRHPHRAQFRQTKPGSECRTHDTVRETSRTAASVRRACRWKGRGRAGIQPAKPDRRLVL
jgi:hypothetical protein